MSLTKCAVVIVKLSIKSELFDKAIEPELRERHMQVVNACHASLGINIGPVVTTEKALGVSLIEGSSGSSWGGIECPDSLVKAGEKLKEAEMENPVKSPSICI